MHFYHVVGPFHKDVASACATQALILHASGDSRGAILHQRRAAMLYELLRGPDSATTIHTCVARECRRARALASCRRARAHVPTWSPCARARVRAPMACPALTAA